MDPNATLTSIRTVQAMDEWLSRGGFLPTAWAVGR
jgi:hypothetical protein